MAILSLIHQADAGSGVFAEAAAQAGRTLEEANLAAGAPPARSLAEYGAVLVFGGSANPDEDVEHPWLEAERALLRDALALELPVLAVCLGAQLLSQAAGGAAPRCAEPEIGWHEVRRTREAGDDPVARVLPPGFSSFQWHAFRCQPPADAAVLAEGAQGIQAFRLGERAWGLQFHAEVTRASVRSWIRDHAPAEDRFSDAAPRFDPEALLAETEARIEEWNALGRTLCGAFLRAADDRR
ncbi:MAG: type 1 glutamine amidotransferase [Thermoleophilaceae bacterium]|nr:type 1 glutamine amidotransferase [Thermoleophilaceae bacterium]MBA3838755.1 type 1 glutamine amidotransferase [Thermoleophilaceae bacterium]